MANRLPAGTYGPTAKFFHWLIVLLLAAQYAIGSIMPHIGRKTLDEGWVHWHFLVGARADVEQVARQLGFEFWKMDQHVIHDGRVVRFDQRGVVVSSDTVGGL